jgi:3-dehydroquinate dehydratase type I
MSLPGGLCLSGNEQSHSELDGRLAQQPGLLHEVRLDHLKEVNDATFALLATKPNLLVCCRARRQGGHFAGSESERLELLRRAAASARLVDVEADVPAEAIAGVPPTKLLLSWHDFDGVPSDLSRRLDSMSQRRPALLKLAVQVDDAGQLLALRDQALACPWPLVMIGMGPAGLLSRSHFRGFGSPFCYVAATADTATAPGQLDFSTARAMNMPASSDAPMYALLGGRQIAHSPGPSTYNRLLRSRGKSGSYVPVVTQQLQPTLQLLQDLGLLGASVTMPLKQQAYEQSQPSSLAERLKAANSLRPGANGWQSHNTDVSGVQIPLGPWVKPGQRVLILGAGGAARAAAAACRNLNLRVLISARQQPLASAIGSSIAWEQRDTAPHDILINATPIAGADSPWPAKPQAAVVFDLAMSPSSRLLDSALAAGCKTLSATTMWLHQGLEQMRWFGEEDLGIEELRQCLRATDPRATTAAAN